MLPLPPAPEDPELAPMNAEVLSILDDIAAAAPNRLRPDQTFRVRVRAVR